MDRPDTRTRATGRANWTNVIGPSVAVRVSELLADHQDMFSVRALARRSGLGVNTVRSVLAGSSDPTLSTLICLSRALGVGSLDELVDRPTVLRLAESVEALHPDMPRASVSPD